MARHGQRKRLCLLPERRSPSAVQVNSRIWALEKERMAADSTRMAAYVEALHLRRPHSVQVTVKASLQPHLPDGCSPCSRQHLAAHHVHIATQAHPHLTYTFRGSCCLARMLSTYCTGMAASAVTAQAFAASAESVSNPGCSRLQSQDAAVRDAAVCSCLPLWPVCALPFHVNQVCA